MPPMLGNPSMRAKANLAKAQSAAKAPTAKSKTTKSKATLSKETVSDSDNDALSSEPESDAEGNSSDGKSARFNMNQPFTQDDSDSDASNLASKRPSKPQTQSLNSDPSSPSSSLPGPDNFPPRSPSPSINNDTDPASDSDDSIFSALDSNPFQEAEDEAAAERALHQPMSLNAKRRLAAEKRAAKLEAKKSGVSVKARGSKNVRKPAAKTGTTISATSARGVKGKAPAKGAGVAAQTPTKPAASKAKATPKAAGRRRVNPETGGELSLSATMHPSSSSSHAAASTPNPANNLVSEARILSLPKAAPPPLPGVLIRGTARSVQWRKRNGELFEALKAQEATWTGHFRILDLPAELRNRIWRFAVVEPVVFIWPANLVGREQPDLAKVSRQVRGEVLPLFYGENVFAVDVSPGTPMQQLLKHSALLTLQGDVSGIVKWATGLTVRKWGTAPGMHESVDMDWFGLIRHWAFPCSLRFATAPTAGFLGISSALTFQSVPETNCVVSVTFPKPGQEGGAKVEVHRDAVCLLPAIEDGRENCTAGEVPGWLKRELVAVGLGKADVGAAVKRWQFAALAKMLQAEASQLMHARCEKVVASVEVEAGVEGSVAG